MACGAPPFVTVSKGSTFSILFSPDMRRFLHEGGKIHSSPLPPIFLLRVLMVANVGQYFFGGGTEGQTAFVLSAGAGSLFAAGTVVAAALDAIALVATVVWSFALLRAPLNFPWYSVFYIFAGELLALFIAGMALTLFFIVGGSIIHRCPSCGAPMTLRELHFTKSQKPHWTDTVLLLLFVAINVGMWVSLLHQKGVAH